MQGEIEAALEKLTGSPVRVTGSGRTDSGVHALGQVAHFKTASRLETRVFCVGLNALLPPDVSVLEAREHDAPFDARRHATGKIYRYEILNRREKPALERGRLWHQREPLDIEVMRKGAANLIGEHDFKSFRGRRSSTKTTVRNIRRIDVKKHGDRITIEIEGTAFLKNMVRAIVGTLVEVGRGKWPPEKVEEALKAMDRSKAGPTAPAHGLYLVKVFYR